MNAFWEFINTPFFKVFVAVEVILGFVISLVNILKWVKALSKMAPLMYRSYQSYTPLFSINLFLVLISESPPILVNIILIIFLVLSLFLSYLNIIGLNEEDFVELFSDGNIFEKVYFGYMGCIFFPPLLVLTMIYMIYRLL